MLGAALAGFIGAWVLALVVPLAYVRLSLALHELMHVRPASRVSWFHRLAMIFDTPLGLGYREHRATHLAHHRHAGTTRDPELYQIRGSHLRAFAFAMISPEYAAVTFVRRHGVTRVLAREACARATLFVLLVAWNPAMFACYWVVLRACIGASSFVFHHLLHSQGGRLGHYDLPPAVQRALPLAQALFGLEPVIIVRDHRRHHAAPGVRARDLPAVAEGAVPVGSPVGAPGWARP
jgi:fatty acid desaturase